MRHPAALLATALLPLITLSTAGTAFASGVDPARYGCPGPARSPAVHPARPTG